MLRLVIPALTLTTAAPRVLACRYNVRELGFVEAGQPGFRIAVFVRGGDHAGWLPPFQQQAQELAGRSNLRWDIIDETAGAAERDLQHRALLGPRLPGGVVVAPGRADGWPVYLHLEGAELTEKISGLVTSTARRQVVGAVIGGYAAILLLRGTDESANAAARSAVAEAIAATDATLADLPKRIAAGPRLVEVDPSLPSEQIVAWALGVDGRDLPGPVAAVVYGRGRLAGPALRDTSLTAHALRGQLAVVGADCECTLDHAWMTAGAIPLAFTKADESALPAMLGFDPSAAAVKAEVSHILAAQAMIAADPAALRGAGYRELPLEIVTTTPGERAPGAPLPAGRGVRGWLWTALAVLLTAAVAWKLHRARK